MRKAFNGIMRVVSTLVGLLMVLAGGAWMMQGLGLATGPLSRSPMQGDQHWAIYGAILAIVGICQIVWSNIRQRGN